MIKRLRDVPTPTGLAARAADAAAERLWGDSEGRSWDDSVPRARVSKKDYKAAVKEAGKVEYSLKVHEKSIISAVLNQKALQIDGKKCFSKQDAKQACQAYRDDGSTQGIHSLFDKVRATLGIVEQATTHRPPPRSSFRRREAAEPNAPTKTASEQEAEYKLGISRALTSFPKIRSLHDSLTSALCNRRSFQPYLTQEESEALFVQYSSGNTVALWSKINVIDKQYKREQQSLASAVLEEVKTCSAIPKEEYRKIAGAILQGTYYGLEEKGGHLILFTAEDAQEARDAFNKQNSRKMKRLLKGVSRAIEQRESVAESRTEQLLASPQLPPRVYNRSLLTQYVQVGDREAGVSRSNAMRPKRQGSPYAQRNVPQPVATPASSPCLRFKKRPSRHTFV